jgi:hypothetical protein
MNIEQLIARANEARSTWVALDERRKIRIIAINEGDIQDISAHAGDGQKLREALLDRAVTGWEGFVESDIDPNGNSEPLKFDPLAFRYWYRCNSPFWPAIEKAAVEQSKAATERLASIKEKL